MYIQNNKPKIKIPLEEYLKLKEFYEKINNDEVRIKYHDSDRQFIYVSKNNCFQKLSEANKDLNKEISRLKQIINSCSESKKYLNIKIEELETKLNKRFFFKFIRKK